MTPRDLQRARATVRRLAPPHERDEAEGVALLALALAWRRYEPARGPWRPWAARHVRRDVLRYVLRRRRAEGREVSVDEARLVDHDLAPEVCDRLARAERIGGPLVRWRLEGRTQDEIAGRLGVHRGTVSKLEARIIHQLDRQERTP